MRNCPFCAEEVQDQAIVCKHCGRDIGKANNSRSPDKSRGTEVNPVVAFVIIVLFGIAIVAWYAGGYGEVSDASGKFVMPQRITALPPVVTRSEFNRIESGMSYSQVRQIIGAPGEELSRSDLAGYTTVMYSWTNSNGSNMNAMFQNDQLINKAQFGLP